MKPAPPVTRMGRSAMTVITLQQGRQSGTPGARLDSEGIEDFLASQHAMLRLVIGIRAIRVRGRLQNLGTQLAMLGSLGEDRLSNQQRRRRLMAAIVIGTPEWRLT